MINKDITFIYMDSAEKGIMECLAKEAESRGYKTKLTNNKFEKCEIGVYCQHINFPQFSKFSLIMLHDIIQQYGNWPDIWLREPWNKYDIGILPSDQWVKNWNECSHIFYARPRKGMFKVGWPKADIISNLDIKNYRKEFYEKYGLDPEKKTILYAPAWENDNKQDDFVQSMLGLNVNILIKQWDADPEKFPQVVNEIQKMEKLHKGLQGVTILPPSTNIFNAILASDILVSEESSTMSEAAMVGIPAVSVSNWLIPDVTPSRFPVCNYDFVEMTKKEELRECISKMISNYDQYKKKTEIYAKNNFSNIGISSKMIIDIIDDVVMGNKPRYECLKAKDNYKIGLKRTLRFYYYSIKREINYNYCERYPMLRPIWNLLKSLRHLSDKK